MKSSSYPDVLKLTDIENGSATVAYGHHGLVTIIDYQALIGLGVLVNHSTFRGIGRRASISTAVTGDDIWEGVSTSLAYPNQTTGEQCTLVSTSANDTSAGSGAQQVDVHYLTNTGEEAHEVVTMNGTTPVNTVATNIRFVQHIHTSRVSTLGTTAAGDIKIYSTATPANIFNIIKAGGNVSLGSHRMVPLGKNFYMNYIKADGVDNKPLSIRLRATCDYDGVLTPNVFIFNEVFELENATSYMNLATPRVFPPLCIIKGTAYASSVGGNVSLSYGGWLE